MKKYYYRALALVAFAITSSLLATEYANLQNQNVTIQFLHPQGSYFFEDKVLEFSDDKLSKKNILATVRKMHSIQEKKWQLKGNDFLYAALRSAVQKQIQKEGGPVNMLAMAVTKINE